MSEVTEPVKASMEDTDVQKKLDVLALADKLGNVAEASRLSGV
ncbi:TPA: helix-turn-helix domain-containing protein, partial [Salmonella enterica subsp. enterica serovar Eastbourne]|nr:helix-turn-helix domain-containing protein [Salmonella enterica subsp. enterica serovar Eastbourne]